MTAPTKVTDELLAMIYEAMVVCLYGSHDLADDALAPIRKMRERAATLCASANPSTALSMVPGYEDETPVSTAALARLKEILP